MATRCETECKAALEGWIKGNGLVLADPDAPEDFDTNHESDHDLRRTFKTADGLMVKIDLTGFTKAFQIRLTWVIASDEIIMRGDASMFDHTSKAGLTNFTKAIGRKVGEIGGDPGRLTEEDKAAVRQESTVPEDDPSRAEDRASIDDLIGGLDDSLRLFRTMWARRRCDAGGANRLDIEVRPLEESERHAIWDGPSSDGWAAMDEIFG